MQLSLFDGPLQQSELVPSDMVEVVEVDKEQHAEIYYYRHYYCPQLIGKVGAVQVVNNNSVCVLIDGEQLLFERPELKKLHKKSYATT